MSGTERPEATLLRLIDEMKDDLGKSNRARGCAVLIALALVCVGAWGLFGVWWAMVATGLAVLVSLAIGAVSSAMQSRRP